MKLEKLLYQIKNWRAHWRAFYLGSYIVVEGAFATALGAMAGRSYLLGTLNATVTRANPKWWQSKTIDLGCIGKRVVTTAGVNFLRDEFANAANDIGTLKYHGCGTGAVAEAITDTALGAECTTVLNPDSTRAVGTQVNSTSKVYQSVGTLTFDGAANVTEHGIFFNSVAGTLWDRTVFAAVGVAALDSIQFTYTLTISDGG